MARPLRIEFPGAVYHVTSRGNERREIFRDDADRELFLANVGQASVRYGFVIHAYCLMGNHYHLLVETPKANLSRGMQRINGDYTQGFNRRHRRAGHLFQGRFKAVLVEKETHLLELCRYVVLNPVRARGMKMKTPADWRWSSYRATAGMETAPAFLSLDWILSRFGGTRKEARRRYVRFVAEGLKKKGSPLDGTSGQIVLGSATFLEEQAERIEAKKSHREHTRMQRHAARPSLAAILGRRVGGDRASLAAAAWEAHVTHGYTLKAIADYLGVHYATAGRLVRAARAEKRC